MPVASAALPGGPPRRLFAVATRKSTYPLIWTQMFIIGVHSVPVIMITGGFVGMTLAVQAYDQLAGMAWRSIWAS